MSQQPPDGLFCQQCPYKQHAHTTLEEVIADLVGSQTQQDHPTSIEKLRELAVLTKPEDMLLLMAASEQGRRSKKLSDVAAKPNALAELRKTVRESLQEVHEAAIAMAEGAEGATIVAVEVENIMDAVNSMLAKTAKGEEKSHG